MQDDWFPDLSDRHRQGIRTTLAILDESLCTFEQWAKGREIQSVLYTEKNRLSPLQREMLLAQTSKIREMLLEIKKTLKIEAKSSDAVSSIWAHCASLWVNLVELGSTKLIRYGELPTGFAEYLDPKIKELVASINAISEAIRKE